MIQITTKGDYSKLNSFLERALETIKIGDLDRYGREGVEALKQATPKDTGLTADSWYYEIERKEGSVSLSFHNSNVVKGIPIAIILQYGHGTRNGGWVEGRDYINPAVLPIFEKIAEKAWTEIIIDNTRK